MNLLPPSTPQFGTNYDVGWIGFLAHPGFVPRGIEWFTRFWRGSSFPPVCHVFVIAAANKIVEANGDGVDLVDVDEYFDTPGCTVYLRKPLGWTAPLGDRISFAAQKYVGFKYDYQLIVADALSYSLLGRALNGVTGGAVDAVLTNLATHGREMICDQVAVAAMQAQPELRPIGTLREPACQNNPQKLFGDDTLFLPDVTVIKGAKEISDPQFTGSLIPTSPLPA